MTSDKINEAVRDSVRVSIENSVNYPMSNSMRVSVTDSIYFSVYRKTIHNFLAISVRNSVSGHVDSKIKEYDFQQY